MSAFRKVVCVAVLAMAVFAARARAAVPHTVMPGETLWSIAAANNFPTQTLAAYNGLSEDSQVYVGETIQIPTEADGATTLASGGTSTTSTTSSSYTSPSTSGISHTVQTGESLSSIAAANGISPYTLAADNGLSSDALLTAGQQLTIPATSSSTSTAPTPSTTSSGTGTATSSVGSPPPEEHPSWTSPIYCPSCPNGEAYLSSNAAYNWNAMRQASLDTYGIDLYPAGPFSAYRSYSQQLYLYNLYLAGQGSLAAVPGSSSHEYGSAVDLAEPSMRTVIDQIGATYGWAKTEASDEWWHVNYVGP